MTPRRPSLPSRSAIGAAASLAAGLATSLLGAGGVAAWLWRGEAWSTTVVAVLPLRVPTSVGFLAGGLALLLIRFGWARLAAFTGALLATGAAAAYLRLFGGLGTVVEAPSAAGAVLVSPPTALTFLLAGMALALASRARVSAGILASITFSLGAVALLGLVADLAVAFTLWEEPYAAALITAVGFTALGGGLLAVLWTAEGQGEAARASWRPLLAGIAATLASLLFWQALRQEQEEQLRRTVDATAAGVRGEVQARVESMVTALENLVQRGRERGWVSPEGWRSDARLTAAAFAGFEAVEWIDAGFARRVVASRGDAPRPLKDADVDVTLLEDSLAVVQRRGSAVVVGPFHLPDGATTFRVIVPLLAPGRPEAFLAGVFAARQAFSPLSEHVAPGYRISIACGSRVVHRTEGNWRVGGRSTTVPLAISAWVPWRLTISPTPEVVAVQRTPLPEVALGAGTAIAILLTLTLRFGELARSRADHLESVVAERTAELAAANAAKDRFMTMLGHELRNPLGSLRTALEVLEAGPGDPQATTRMREIVLRQVGHLGRLVDDLLDVARIKQGRLAVRPRPLDLADLVRQTAAAKRPAIESAGLTLKTAISPHPLHVDGDATRLVQVLDNLLSNAVRFTPPGGAIEVAAGAPSEADTVRVSVRDTGSGIAGEHLVSIFEPFSRATSAAGDPHGLGLGLALVKGLVEAHDGTVRVTSEGPGRGTEVMVELPRGERAPEESLLAPEPPGPSAARRIVVIDDHRDSALGLATLLSTYGHRVETAHDGPAGLDLVRRFHPHLVISDIDLPRLSGYDLARALKDDPSTASIRLLALTGYGDRDTVRKSYQAGFDAHLTKPVDPARLRGLLARMEAPEVVG